MSDGNSGALGRADKKEMIINGIHLAELLSSCIDACRRGCEVIRNVKNKSLNTSTVASDNAPPSSNEAIFGAVDGSVAAGSEISTGAKCPTKSGTLDVKYKIADDPRSALTEADESSQKVIESILREAWASEIEKGVLKIVGEEDESDGSRGSSDDGNDEKLKDCTDEKGRPPACGVDADVAGGGYAIFDKYKSPRPDVEPIQKDMFSNSLGSESVNASGGNDSATGTTRKEPLDMVNKPVIIFIDPMDGTREFVENRVRNVQCLIGITYGGLPLGGAVGMPLVHRDKIEVAYGLVEHRVGSNDKVLKGQGHGRGVNSLLSGVKYFDAVNSMTITGLNNGGDSAIDGLDAINHETSDSSSALDDSETLVVLSGDSKKPILKVAMENLETRVLCGLDSDRNESTEAGCHDKDDNVDNTPSTRMRKYPPYRKIVAGGCGNKILYVGRRSQAQRRERCEATGVNLSSSPSEKSLSQQSIVGAISVAPAGSSSWDTASPTAVLLALDPLARVTDLIGRPLIYDGVRLTNEAGVVVSSGDVAVRVHEDLTGRLSKDESFLSMIGLDLNLDRIEKAPPTAANTLPQPLP
eukprot:CAMPEP_0171425524 /NCGR_PEP_ID=MMETSP0881-20121228/3381_1 /TAXON_ID=67004 /ORGANISM="Thalassiosira weissflogii, Strain CCMP1336" /LENGTH=582 /DNA_ID=CAMNT_0011944859 /DNA_START=108 /DNA_END=1856 /DNA_ORIENTATION=+